MNLEESLVSRILSLDSVSQAEISSCEPDKEYQVEQFIPLLLAVAAETCFVLNCFLGIHLHRNMC
jgi:hypothetical protein